MAGDRIIVRVDADLEDLVPEFLENRREDVQTMTGALTRQDFETIRRLGHSMKGAGGGYGFDAITDIGRAIEEAAKAGQTAEIKRRIDELASYLERVDVVYEEMDY
jgi:HPt (histidine-containing phosphotransfer) domain-containing protein